MNDKGDVKIADFGMSKKLDNSGDLVESYVGTMLYMTPERLKGEKYTATTDL
jgi:serine/threonine protein kinase